MRIGQMPTPQTVFDKLDVMRAFQERYLRQEPWERYQSQQVAHADLADPQVAVDFGDTAVRPGRPLMHYFIRATFGACASYYLALSDPIWLWRNGMGLPVVYDLWRAGGTPLLARQALAVATPWQMTGTLVAAEWLVGRPAQGPEVFNIGGAFGRRVVEHITHHGLVGCAIEQAPLALGKALQAARHTVLSAACTWAACLGRLSLMPARMAVLALSTLNTCFWTGLATAVLMLTLASCAILSFVWETFMPPRRTLGDVGLDPHTAGRPRRTYEALTRLRIAHRRQDQAVSRADGAALTAALPSFIRQLKQSHALPPKAPCGRSWLAAAQMAEEQLRAEHNKLCLPLEKDDTVCAWDVGGFVWMLLEKGALDSEADRRRDRHARRIQKICFVQNLVQCIDVCATRQAQHLLLPLQGFIGNFCIDEARVRSGHDAQSFIQQHLDGFQKAPGVPVDDREAVHRGKAMMHEALAFFGRQPAEFAKVKAALSDFLDLSYDASVTGMVLHTLPAR